MRLLIILLGLLHCLSLDAKDFLLAETAPLSIDPSGYLVSEKLDGVRAMWDGKQLLFRSGNFAHAPGSFTALFPKQRLDGELWLGHQQFAQLSGIVRSHDADWSAVKFVVFELPGAAGTFAERSAQIETIVRNSKSPNLFAARQYRVKDNAELRAELARVEAAGGEGLMLHWADDLYQSGRRPALLKYKSTQDAEATVLAYFPGKGQFEGMMGSLEVKTDQGVRFKLGTGFKKADRANPPELGSRITFRYQGLTRYGKPRFARFVRVRIDP